MDLEYRVEKLEVEVARLTALLSVIKPVEELMLLEWKVLTHQERILVCEAAEWDANKMVELLDIKKPTATSRLGAVKVKMVRL